MTFSRSKTSAMRSPETVARGKITKSIERFKNAIKICMAYCMNAIKSPTCILDWATWCAPTHIIRICAADITKTITGIIKDIVRPMPRMFAATSLLALSKRSSSKLCLLKARTTSIPERFSRIIKLRRSISFCMRLKRGVTRAKMSATKSTKITTAKAMVHHMLGLLSMA